MTDSTLLQRKSKEEIKNNKKKSVMWKYRIRSGEKPEHIVSVINKCVKKYQSKWRKIRTLLFAHECILSKIQKQDNNEMPQGYLTIRETASNKTMHRELKTDVTFENENTKWLTQHEIEEMLKKERNDELIYFIAVPPKHNAKQSPWTKRILLILKDSRIVLSSPLDPNIPFVRFVSIPKKKRSIKPPRHFKEDDDDEIIMLEKESEDTDDDDDNNNDDSEDGDSNEDENDEDDDEDDEDGTKSIQVPVQNIHFQFYSKLTNLQLNQIEDLSEQFYSVIPQFPKEFNFNAGFIYFIFL
ncbi:hypothetical protein RFI_18813 [Reticulomyxa filosa]|uniref:Uncharacterized protein n=1 Tax=Reticulomyxa filosa TaxID=46433 RepID=X6MYA9_RETFI|nr:hypothetical protein RFI_18813 [Reticulomyxa filosa]|eukprot:ETO18452.1 hypothetical protein RFI_18813 [Reticulomyxa filosa]